MEQKSYRFSSRARKHADRRWDERMNKTMDNSSYIVQQSHNDYRTNQRGSWLDTRDRMAESGVTDTEKRNSAWQETSQATLLPPAKFRK